MGFSDFLGTMGQLFKAVGTATLTKLEQVLAHQLASELAAQNPERRMTLVDKIREALNQPEYPLAPGDREKIDAELIKVALEPRPAAALLAFTEAAGRAGWNQLQRIAFLQRVVPSQPIDLGDVRVGDPAPPATPNALTVVEPTATIDPGTPTPPADPPAPPSTE